ncbi:MAG: S-layer homology domain-containing protein [Clostridia bacterium]|nr:S-layer homology domain-containing protein [Clostridia bacterium]
MKRKLINLLLVAAITFGLMPISYAADSFTVNAPSDAQVSVYNQEANYKTVKIEHSSTLALDDGTVDYIYDIAPTSNMSYRVSKGGLMTEAGYLGTDTERVVVDLAEKTDTLREGYNAGILLNINERNKIALDIDESFTLRSYRAPWQIVNDTVINTVIEPDFNYNILSGSDVIEIITTDNGNAGDNKAEITAKAEGVAIIEVSCEAIYVDGIYPASSDRNAVAIVTVGDGYGDIDCLELNNEYDTLYFTGDKGTLEVGETFTAQTAKISDGILGEWVDATDGKAEIYHGNNILKVTDDEKTDYRVVKGSKLIPRIEGETVAGGEITLCFDNLYQPIPKMAGLYNPCYFPTWGMPGIVVSYKLGDTTLSSIGTDYFLNEKDSNKITFTIPQDATEKLILTDGKITGENSVFGSIFGEHRKLDDDGIPANLNAASGTIDVISLPDIEIPVTVSNDGGDKGDSDDSGDDGGDNVSDGTLAPSGIYKTHTTSFYGTAVSDFDSYDADGFVTVSFTDKGKRTEECDFQTPLGVIISSTRVPYTTGDSVADVTVRLLDALGINYDISGSVDADFYLSKLKDFKLSDGYEVSSFGQGDGGSLSGWMVSSNDSFLSVGASDAVVNHGDNIKWQFSCQLGDDIGDNSVRGGGSHSLPKKEEVKEDTNIDLAALETEVYNIISEKLINPTVSSVGGEWSVLGLARSSRGINEETAKLYYDNLCNYLKEKNGVLNSRKNTEYSRVAIAVTAIGKNAKDISGYNLLSPLADYDKTVSQGLNGAVWALVALDLYDEDIAERYVDYILDKQLSDGGWSLSGNSSDSDMTAMVLTALSKHKDEEKVSDAIKKGVSCLAKAKSDSAESYAQMIVALCEIGISFEDERFDYLTEKMLDYYTAGEGFSHKIGEEVSLMTTEQCFYAIVAAKRVEDEKNTLFDMQGKAIFSDITAHKYQEKIESLAKRKIINGCGNGTFLPDERLTRAECATIIVIALGLDMHEMNIFNDVKENAWYYEKVAAAYKNGIVMGISDKLFNPDGNVTREEGMAFISRSATLLGIDTDAKMSEDEEVSSWAKTAAGFCTENEIIDSDNGLRPKEELTRAEMANMVYNLLQRGKNDKEIADFGSSSNTFCCCYRL